MAIVEFGNFSIDMRLQDDYGIPAVHDFNAFLFSFWPVREETVVDTSTLYVGRLVDSSNNFVTVSMQGDLTQGQLTSLSTEAVGVRVTDYGTFTVDVWGDLQGILNESRMSLTEDDSVLMRLSGLHAHYSLSNLPDFSPDVLLGGADTITANSGRDYLMGYAGADMIVAGAGNDTLDGGTGDDRLDGGAGDDRLDGGAGRDIVAYGANRSAYAVTGAGSLVSGPDGNDTLTNIERLQFSDMGLAFDLGALESGGRAVRIMGAAFDAPAIQQHPDWVGLGLDLFEAGMTMQQVCTLVVQAMGMTNTNLVTTLYTNVAGAAPDPATLNGFVSLLQGSGGSMTQGQLLELAAHAPPNEVNIDLVGLQRTGVEFV